MPSVSVVTVSCTKVHCYFRGHKDINLLPVLSLLHIPVYEKLTTKLKYSCVYILHLQLYEMVTFIYLFAEFLSCAVSNSWRLCYKLQVNYL